MNSLASPPLDALVFDYATFGVFALVNNLWTWIAVFTAAVSFWRIRIAGGVSVAVNSDDIDRNINDDLSSDECVSDTCPSPEPSVPSPSSALSSDERSSSSSSSGFGDDELMVTKGKFVMYYHEEDDEGCECNGGIDIDGDGDGDDAMTVGGELWGGWETVMRLRMEKEWYRGQDLTVINGNVVRLWDGGRGGKYSSGCVVWSAG